MMRTAFWQLPLDELTGEEWEALCDGCGKCCLHKLEDADSGALLYTRIACQQLDSAALPVRCKVYAHRQRHVPECVQLRAADAPVQAFRWLPSSCAYRLRAEGQALPSWHPLLTGSHAALEAAGISVRGRVVSEAHVHPDGWDEHIVRWV